MDLEQRVLESLDEHDPPGTRTGRSAGNSSETMLPPAPSRARRAAQARSDDVLVEFDRLATEQVLDGHLAAPARKVHLVAHDLVDAGMILVSSPASRHSSVIRRIS